MRKLFSSIFCNSRSFYILFSVIILLFTGCVTTKITVSNSSSKPIEKSSVKKIAVIPFELMLSKSKRTATKPTKVNRKLGEGWLAFSVRTKKLAEARKRKLGIGKNTQNNSAEIVTNLFIAELFNVKDVEIFTLDRIEVALQNMALNPEEVFAKSNAQEVVHIIGLDAFFTGKVFAYTYNKSTNPVNDSSNVSISVNLTSAKTGAMLWTGREARQGQAVDLGVVMRAPSSYELASKAIKNVVASFRNSLY